MGWLELGVIVIAGAETVSFLLMPQTRRVSVIDPSGFEAFPGSDKAVYMERCEDGSGRVVIYSDLDFQTAGEINSRLERVGSGRTDLLISQRFDDVRVLAARRVDGSSGRSEIVYSVSENEISNATIDVAQQLANQPGCANSYTAP